MEKSIVATLDFETDPFKYNRVVEPFCWDLYDGETHTTFWHDNPEHLITKLIEELNARRKPLIIYAHNGGKFDFMFMLRNVRGTEMLLIGNRIVKARCGRHQIRDSYAAMPVKLATFQKDSFDYRKLERSARNQHRDEIIQYLKNDCLYLHQTILKYRQTFGDALTMAGAAMKELSKIHKFEKMNRQQDAFYRKFYYGGRVECFKRGIIRVPFKLYDVNSLYPSVMRDYLHPVSSAGFTTNKISRKTCFVEIRGESFGAFPLRTSEGLYFPEGHGVFNVSIHEYKAAIAAKKFKLKNVLAAHNFMERCTFADFINEFADKKLEAEKSAGIKGSATYTHHMTYREFWKLVMNSSYGKFAQDPRDFEEHQIRGIDEDELEEICACFTLNSKLRRCQCSGWRVSQTNEHQGWRLWSRNSGRVAADRGFYNVATAASITGASRAVLLTGISKAINPLYCDTDSLICEELPDTPIHPTEIGSWKLEHTGDMAAICGKKTYGLFDHGKVIKVRSKGARLSARELLAVAAGRTVTYKQDAPRLTLDGGQRFIKRRIRITK